MSEAALHPLLAHHVLNTLEWPALRPLQQAALAPIASGSHALLVAPTAGGKTEAALFPLLTRLLEQDWAPLSVLYLCPLRALLNNLHPRVAQYAQLVGRRAELWHGDVGDGARDAVRDESPDLLLTTPESIEAMLVSRRTDHERLFRNVRAVVVDEIHAFAGDDRGWHLLAVTERVQHLAGRELQRVALSATIGNAEEILAWLTRTCTGPRQVVRASDGLPQPDLSVDHVGKLDNAAIVISRLHRGEKRLVFVDSRAQAEELAAALRDREVDTYLSHGSLGREERRAAEAAFAGSRDCVIVATSTLELGIDVGDLDRVIQVDAPPTVASLLQRLGRTGRRSGTTPNLLLLCTREDALLQALGLLTAWEQGYVEPLEPPLLPVHLLVQQLLALVLQEGGVGARMWQEWLGDPFVLGPDVARYAPELTRHLVEQDYLFDDNGILGIGEEGRRTFGGRNFLDLMAVFRDPPTLTVVAGRVEIGRVPVGLLTVMPAGGRSLLLGGRDWAVVGVDWRAGVVRVEPAADRGRARWFGDARALSFAVSQAVQRVLAGRDLERVTLSRRADAILEQLRERLWWVIETRTFLAPGRGGRRYWWTFAGAQANAWLTVALGDLSDQAAPGDLSIRLSDHADLAKLGRRLRSLDPNTLALGQQLAQGAVDRLKFADALPEDLARLIVERRLRDDDALRAVAQRPVTVVPT